MNCINQFSWVMVYFPKKSDSIFSRRNSKFYIAICWILPILIMLPSLTGTWDWHALDCKIRSCTIIDNTQDNLMSFKKFLLMVGVGIPALVLVITNVMIFAKVSKQTAD